MFLICLCQELSEHCMTASTFKWRGGGIELNELWKRLTPRGFKCLRGGSSGPGGGGPRHLDSEKRDFISHTDRSVAPQTLVWDSHMGQPGGLGLPGQTLDWLQVVVLAQSFTIKHRAFPVPTSIWDKHPSRDRPEPVGGYTLVPVRGSALVLLVDQPGVSIVDPPWFPLRLIGY